MKTRFALLCSSVVLLSSSLFGFHLQAQEGFTPLFNGENLNGWKTVREQGENGLGPFKVNELEKAIHVYADDKAGTKPGFDCLYTEKEYGDYVLKLDYKWLEKRFKPRLKHDRDAGVMFHVHGNLKKMWPKCVEMQIGDSDTDKIKDRYTTGDLWVIGKDVQAQTHRDSKNFYDPSADSIEVGKGRGYDSSFVSVNAEKEFGEWNEMTVTVKGGAEAIFELNGQVVNRIGAMTCEVDGERAPLAKGRIGLQAEYAEVLYRNIRIKELPSLPAGSASKDE